MFRCEESESYELIERLSKKTPTLWINEKRATGRDLFSSSQFTLNDLADAEERWVRFAPMISSLFPETEGGNGRIRSNLIPSASFATCNSSMDENLLRNGFIKADHCLPVAGCIKARGGFYEVLCHLEDLAIEYDLISVGQEGNFESLLSDSARAKFSAHKISVGSTGNLGFSIGLFARVLGFEVEVHMSSDAKGWKKKRLREIGANVVEHDSDFSYAVEKARQAATNSEFTYFIDDEHSRRLLLGYAVAAFELRDQLEELGRVVGRTTPLFVYIPCGVGGAAAGITYGLRQIFGDFVYCVLVEPVASPCMMIQLIAGLDEEISVYDIGLDNKTVADGMAVGTASMLAAKECRHEIAAIYTVADEALIQQVRRSFEVDNMRLEPSAAAGLLGPRSVVASSLGSKFVDSIGVGAFENSTHVAWTTGGQLVPDEEFSQYFQ